MIWLDAALAATAPLGLVAGLRALFVGSSDEKISLPFVRGAATAFVALIIEKLLWDCLSASFVGNYALAIRAFLFIALPEELVKVSLIYVIAIERHDLGFRRVGILAAAVGAGFAAAENVSYVSHFGEAVLWLRLITATPFHIFVAIVSGKLIYLGVQKRRSEFIGMALLVATLLHGMYDYLLFIDRAGNGKFLFALALTSSLAISLLRQKE